MKEASGYKIAAAVLLGGRSVRMGSPKETMMIKKDGRTFLDRLCDEADLCVGKSITKRYLSERRDQNAAREGCTEIPLSSSQKSEPEG